jgi:small subunit ribosomal protein S6
LESYEITYIVRPDLDEEQIRGVVDTVTSRITGAGGEIVATYPWNPPRRRLAYPIRDFGDGFYVTTTFQFPPEGLKELERAFRLNENLLRFLIVQATELSVQQSQQRSQQAAARAAAASEPQGAGAPAATPPPTSTPAPVPTAPQTEAAPAIQETVPTQPESVPEVAEAVAQPIPAANTEE